MNRSAGGTVYEFSGFTLDVAQRRLVAADGQPVKLTPRVFDTLLCFVEHAGELLDKATLMQAIWPDTVVEENNLNQAITALRKSLGDTPEEHRFIATDPGRGYRFVAEVRIRNAEREVDRQSESTRQWARRNLVLLTIGIATVAVVLLTAKTLLHVPVAPEQSIAVLPCVNMSPDPDQEYFSDGIAEELLNQLARVPGLHVAGRTSSFAFKGQSEDLRVIGEKLNVAHILECSVRKSGGRVRVTVQLVKASDGYQLWSEAFDRNLTVIDIFAIQDETAEAVATALSITLGIGKGDLGAGGTRNFEAYDAYLAGISLTRKFDTDSMAGAIEHLEKAVELDPEYAQAWSLLARVYWLAANLFIEGRIDEFYRKSETAASRAIAIAPESAASLLALAQLQSRKRNWLQAEQTLSQALELAPADYQANLQHGLFCLDVGRPRQAIANFQQALRIEPLLLEPTFRLGNAYEFSGQFELALQEFERGKGLIGNQQILNILRVVLAMETGDRALMEDALHELVTMGGLPADNQLLTSTMATLLDSPDAALAELHGFAADPAFGFPFSRTAVGTWAAYFGDANLALEQYRALYQATEISTYLIWQPLLKDMRQLSAFKNLLRQEGLVDYWRSTGNWGEFCRPLGDDDFECR